MIFGNNFQYSLLTVSQGITITKLPTHCFGELSLMKSSLLPPSLPASSPPSLSSSLLLLLPFSIPPPVFRPHLHLLHLLHLLLTWHRSLSEGRSMEASLRSMPHKSMYMLGEEGRRRHPSQLNDLDSILELVVEQVCLLPCGEVWSINMFVHTFLSDVDRPSVNGSLKETSSLPMGLPSVVLLRLPPPPPDFFAGPEERITSYQIVSREDAKSKKFSIRDVVSSCFSCSSCFLLLVRYYCFLLVTHPIPCS